MQFIFICQKGKTKNQMKISLKDRKFREKIILSYVLIQAILQMIFPSLTDIWYVWIPMFVFVIYLFYLNYMDEVNE